MRLVFKYVLDGEPLQRMGQHIATRRWFDWIQAAFEHLKYWHTRLLALIVIGQIWGVYKDFTDVPLWGDASRKPGDLPEGGEWDMVEAEEAQREAREAGAGVDAEIRRKREEAKETTGSV